MTIRTEMLELLEGSRPTDKAMKALQKQHGILVKGLNDA